MDGHDATSESENVFTQNVTSEQKFYKNIKYYIHKQLFKTLQTTVCPIFITIFVFNFFEMTKL